MNSRILKFLPIIVLGALGVIAWAILKNPPETSFRGQNTGPQMTVEVEMIAPIDFQVSVPSYGIVRPRIQSLLVAQVGGQIVNKSPNFDEGGYFAEGEVMLTIDPRDYEANVMIAEASLADARQSLAEEKARADQAQEDWNRLGNDGEASDLVLRKPQLAAAEARVASADANLIKARLDLERTRIRAPFDGRVLRQIVDLGQVVSANTQLAEFYSVGIAEVRLPIANKDLTFVDLPESGNSASTIKATLYSELAGRDVWEARVVRTEAAIDDTARQLHVLVHVDDPFTADERHQVPLKIGQYVTASIEGRLLEDVIVIPSSAIYQGSYVYVVEQGALQRQEVEIAWSDVDKAIVASGIGSGDQLVTTLLGQVTSGTTVAIAGEESRRPGSDGPRMQPGGPQRDAD
ncbi:MAG: efflux RND transporter periplasmic adaptor subunit [Woeseiaceae bacterium]|nr:efflux RND transporter periplasmic adaptor subunit [Woeseiaceae bacterium]